MTGTKKRSADEVVGEGSTATRPARIPRTVPKEVKGKKGSKVNLRASEFKASALPLHVNLTHTPPSIPDEETVNATSVDPGFIGTTALVPSVFSTGSYGWKGNKRITIELENRETGEKEKVQVMLTMNATVMGSKNAEAEGHDILEAEKEKVAETGEGGDWKEDGAKQAVANEAESTEREAA